MDRLDWVTRFALATDKPRGWIATCLPVTIILTMITALVPGLPTREIYKTYFVDMLPRVQTVDFNMLFHILPSALSNAMAGHHVTELKENPHKYRQISENVQRILDSNYGVFYLLITHEQIKPSDIENEYNQAEVNKYVLYETKNQGLVDVLDRGYIVHSDLILYPQPICNTASYTDPKATEIVENKDCQTEIQKAVNEGRVKVLGRVHYIKGKTPNFWTIAKQFNQNPLGDESGYHFIRHNLLFTFAGFFLAYWIIRLFLKHTVLQYKLKEAINMEKAALYFEKEAIEEVYKRQLLETELKRVEAENRLLKLYEFDEAFRSEIDTIFTAEIGNSLQKLDAQYLTILKRLETDVQNITHDIRKAPLLYSIDVMKEGIARIREEVLSDTEKMALVLEFLEKTDLTIQTITQVINNLQEMISLESKPCRLSNLLRDFESNLPATARDIDISFSYENCDCFIQINPWHFKSILKNILYNSRRALVNKMLDEPDFEPKLKIACSIDDKTDEVQVIVEDNGGGIPEEIVDSLYQVPQRLNTRQGNQCGNGSMIVFAYLSLHNGSAKAENLKDGGARISIRFPVCKTVSAIS